MAQAVRSRFVVLLALFVSGAAGLMHEVVWAKLLVSLIGNTADSNAVVLCVFMGGLAIGAVVFGRSSDRWGRPLLTYAWLEALIGIYCLPLPLIIKAAGGVYEGLARDYFEQTQLLLGLRVVLAVLIVLPPAILMGATLPVLAKALVHDVARTRKEVAALYAMNNLGAVFGSGLAGFVLLAALGIWGSLATASVFNFLAAGLVVAIHLMQQPEREAPAPAPEAPRLAQPVYSAATYKVTLLALLFSGFAAMGYEVMMIRVIALAFGSSTYSFTVMLMCFITGISIGAGLISLVHVRRPLLWLGVSQLLVVVAFVAVTPLISRLPYYIGLLRIEYFREPNGFVWHQVWKALLSMAVLLVPTAAIGIGFPLVTQVQARSLSKIGGTVGSTYAWNTVGNVLGVLVTGQVLLNHGGIQRCFDVNLIMSLIAGVLILSVAVEWPRPQRLATGGVAGAFLLIYFLGLHDWPDPINKAFNHLRMRQGPPEDVAPEIAAIHPSHSFEAWRETYVMSEKDPGEIFFEEDENATVMAVDFSGTAALFINTKPEASCAVEGSDMNTQLSIAHLPLLFNTDSRQLFMIGLGSGVTLGTAMLHPSLERGDLAEISQAVLNASPLFANYTYHVLDNPKVHKYQEDARTFMRTVPRKYDVIISEPSNPWISGVSGLFTVEFFEECRDALEPGGILMMWFHQYEMSDDNVRLVLRTLHHVFQDNVYVFLPDLADVICLASAEPLELDFALMEERFDQPQIRSDLSKIKVFNLSTLLAYHLISPGRLGDFVGQGPLNTDDHQRLEYEAPKSLFDAEESQYLHFAEGHNVMPDGSTDSLLERYRAYRATTGEPLSRAELGLAASHVETQHAGADRSRLTNYVRGLAAEAPETPQDVVAGYSPARGGVPDPTSCDFVEANNRGAVLYLLEQSEPAIALFERAVELQPDNIDARLNLGVAQRKSGDFEAAMATFRSGAERAPDEKRFKIQIASTHLQQNEVEPAKEILQGVVLANQDAPDAVACKLLGDISAHEGDVDQAVFWYQTAVENNVQLWQAGVRLIDVLMQDPANYQRASEALDTILYYNHGNPVLADVRRELDERIAAYQEHLSGGDRAPEAGPQAPIGAASGHEGHDHAAEIPPDEGS